MPIEMAILCIAVSILVTNLIRVLPVTLIRKRIRSRFLRSFLYYVPYVTLAVMTVPAIFLSAANPLAGAISLVVGIAAAWMGLGLFPVAAICSATAYLSALLILA